MPTDADVMQEPLDSGRSLFRRKGPATWPREPRKRRDQLTEEVDANSGRIQVVRRNGDVHWIYLDIGDLGIASRYTWWIDTARGTRSPYAATTESEAGRSRHYLLHRLLTAAPEGGLVDHRDGNGLNNRRSNLRIASTTQNRANERARRIGTSSEYKGVFQGQAEGWMAQCVQGGRFTHLGTYDRQIDAALAYDDAMRREFGEFAATNFTAEFAASAERQPRRRRKRGRTHGTSGYEGGCRCATCVEAARAYWRARHLARRKAG